MFPMVVEAEAAMVGLETEHTFRERAYGTQTLLMHQCILSLKSLRLSLEELESENISETR